MDGLADQSQRMHAVFNQMQLQHNPGRSSGRRFSHQQQSQHPTQAMDADEAAVSASQMHPAPADTSEPHQQQHPVAGQLRLADVARNVRSYPSALAAVVHDPEFQRESDLLCR
jgi:hypothetical protein